jgi:hypothetical protein
LVEEAVKRPSYPAVYDSAKVPAVVTGEPETEKPVGADRATLVTEPVPKPKLEVAVQRVDVPVLRRTWLRVPADNVVSRRLPVTVRLVIDSFVDVALPTLRLVMFDVVALLVVALIVTPFKVETIVVPVKVGEVENTAFPVPVSSDNKPANW